jgi:hypothetical protein
MFSQNKTKWFSVLLAAFTAAQASMPQFEAMLTPLWYAGITIVVGIVATVLGRLKMATGGFLYRNKLTIIGVLAMVFGVVQGVASQFEPLLGPDGFKIFTGVLSFVLAVVGFMNSAADPPPPDQNA